MLLAIVANICFGLSTKNEQLNTFDVAKTIRGNNEQRVSEWIALKSCQIATVSDQISSAKTKSNHGRKESREGVVISFLPGDVTLKC